MDGPLTPSEASLRFRRFLADDERHIEAWAVTLATTGQYIGHAFLVSLQADDEAEVGFILQPSEWRHGYGTEVAETVVEYALESGKYNRVVATVDADHASSIKVLECAGMLREREVREEQPHYFVYSRSRVVR